MEKQASFRGNGVSKDFINRFKSSDFIEKFI